jgi:hypothetical protein
MWLEPHNVISNPVLPQHAVQFTGSPGYFALSAQPDRADRGVVVISDLLTQRASVISLKRMLVTHDPTP